MNQKLEYLTDEELLLLMAEVEEKDLVAAPPDLLEGLLATVGRMETGDASATKAERKTQPIPVSKVSMEKRRKEYRAYCFRVITSVAAAIALVFLLPQTASAEHREPPAYTQEITPGRYESKEEALGASNMLTQKLGSTNWFEHANQWNIFEKIDGGFNNETTQKK